MHCQLCLASKQVKEHGTYQEDVFEILRLIEEKRVQQVAPLTKTLGAYDRKLEDVLELSDLPADTQMKLSDQQAQRWHTYQEKQNQPLPVNVNVVPQGQQDLKDGAQVGVPKSSKDGVEEDILESVHKSMRVKARWLLQRMKRSDVLN